MQLETVAEFRQSFFSDGMEQTTQKLFVSRMLFFFLLNIMRDDLQKCVTSEERFKYSIIISHSANKIPYLIAEL